MSVVRRQHYSSALIYREVYDRSKNAELLRADPVLSTIGSWTNDAFCLYSAIIAEGMKR
jgi:hypothetical protein